MDDIKIAEKCVGGELDYFKELYEKYIDKIYKFIYLKTSCKEISEDITSEVFLSALNSIKSFKIDENSSVQAWLYRIANNKVIDFYRTNKQSEELGDYLDIGISHDLGQEIDNKDKLKEVLKYLKDIKKEYSEVLILKIWNDLSYKEISEITGKSTSNCKKIVSRTLKTISANLTAILLFLIIL